MFFIEKEDKLTDKEFCRGFKDKIINAFNSNKLKSAIDPKFLEYVYKQDSIVLSKEVSYSVDCTYICDVTFAVELKKKYDAPNGNKIKTIAESKIENCVRRRYNKHLTFNSNKAFKLASLAEIYKLDIKNILMEIKNNGSLFEAKENYFAEEDLIKREYEESVDCDIQVEVKTKKVQIILPDISQVDVFAEYKYFASIWYDGKKYKYYEDDDLSEALYF